MTQPNSSLPPRALVPSAAALRPRTSALSVAAMIVLGLIGVGVVVLLVINASPLPVVISALAAAISFPLLIACASGWTATSRNRAAIGWPPWPGAAPLPC